MRRPTSNMKKRLTAAVALGLIGVASASTLFVREKAGSIWQDGLFVGDGQTGAMCYAPMHLEWTINRNDVLDTRVFACDYVPHEEVMRCVATNAGHSVAFLDKGERATIKGPVDGDRLTQSMSAAVLRLRFWSGVGWSMPSIPATRQELDTRTGELTESMTSPFLTPEATTFVERSRDVMAVKLGDARGRKRTAVVELARQEDPRLDPLPFEWACEDGVAAFVQKLPGGETYAVALSVPGVARTRGRTAEASVSGERTLFLAVRTTRDAADPRAAAVAAVRAAEKDGFAKVRADHRAWWKDFWAKGARATFASDAAVDTQWNYSLYALASQFGKAPMPALNGLTYGPLDGGNGGVGSNCYVHDQNVQIPMMPFFPLGHAEFVDTFVATYENALPELERRTKEVFGAKGAYLPLNMNQFGFEHPIADYRYTLCGGAYSGLVLAQAWWYTQDEAILKRIYPLLKKFILFYTDTATKDADGTYHFIWSVPPEIFTGSKDETATIACLRPCLETAVEAATRFKCDAAERTLWKDILAHYPKIARHSEGGWWCGPEIPDDHYMYGGHLFYPFFPSEADTDPDVAKKTLDYVWKYAVEISYETPEPHPVHEWSALYTGIAATRLFGGERGWKALKDFHAAFGKPSGLFSHNPIIVTDLTEKQAIANVKKAPKLMRRNCHGKVSGWGRGGPNDLTYNPDSKRLVAPVLEGGAAFLLLSSEALCQGWGGEIRLFPSVPKGFSGRFENFRVRGGYVVSAEMKDGALVDYAIKGVKPEDKVRVSCPTDPSFVQLPGEPAWKKPLSPGPFPDVLSAYVFRNWGLVPKRVLAETIGALETDVTTVATEMGLDPDPKVSPRWRDMGYVTILRRNWHLVPYSQLMKLVGKDRRQMRYSIVEDDYLATKLGMPKPDCPRLVYTAESAAAGRTARERLRATLEAEGVKIVDPNEVPRFAFLNEFGKLVSHPSSHVPHPTSPRFDVRMIYPFCMDYGDPLDDKEISSCPEGLVADLAARGINAVWMHVVLSTLTTDPAYPEFDTDAKRRVANLRRLVERCARHGVKVILYVNEPRAQPAAFFDRPDRAAMRGTVDSHNGLAYCRCTRHPETLRWLKDALTQLFTNVPGLGGVFTITMSENATHCGSQGKKAVTCARCRDVPLADLVVDVNTAIFEGVKRGNPDAHVFFYDTAWELVGDGLATIVPRLPKGGRLVVWSEKYQKFNQGGLDLSVNEYSISHPGPFGRATALWETARKAGLKADAKLQVNDSWEISTVPYLPAMDLVAEHAFNLSTSAVDGVMLSWSLGGYPGPGLELFSRFRKGANDSAAILDAFAADAYGKSAVPAVRTAWTAYSEAYRNYPMQWQTVYYSPVQMGPANLLYPEKSGWPATMVNTPYDDLDHWTLGYAANRQVWLDQMRKVAEGFDRADRLWNAAVEACAGAAKAAAVRDGIVFRAATLTFRTCVTQAEFIQARDRGDRAGMKAAAEAELRTAKEMLGLVRRDSSLGYESTNRYLYVPNDLLEKILNCRAVLSAK